MRSVAIIAVIGALAMPAVALAQDDSSTMGFGQPLPDIAPANCAAPQIVNSVQMIHLANRDGDLVPVTINGEPRNFLLDTGSDATQIQRPVAEELKLPIQQSNTQSFDLTGQVASEQTFVGQFTIGRLRGDNVNFLISPDIDSAKTSDGFFAMSDMIGYDVDMDFGTDKLTFYSQDHCPGVVPYWAMAATAVIPITMMDNHILVPVTLDGREFRAWVDTGATFTSLDMQDAQTQYGLTMGDTSTPALGNLNDDPSLQTYSHTFGKLSFGDITVSVPRVTIIPNAMAESLEKNRKVAGLVGPPSQNPSPSPGGPPAGPISTGQNLPEPPELIVGMDVLRKLHLYMALGDNKMYISRASEPTAEAAALQASLQPQTALQARFRQVATKAISDMDKILAQEPQSVPALNERCYMRAALKVDLDLALADCQQAVRLRPGDDKILDSLAFLLYQQGKYQESLDTYNRVLAINAGSAPSLFMRGYARGMLGDSAGKEADIRTATRTMPDIQRTFQQYNISY